jgi:hypothetical protein
MSPKNHPNPPTMSEDPAPDPYVAGPVERFGRRMKMEYVGMASVYAVVALLFFGALAPWSQLAATAGTFFLFLGLKKKTRDHLCGSFLLFAAAAVARQPLALAEWAVPYLLFGACVYAMEGYLEKRRGRIYWLPLFLGLWSATDSSWLLGLIFVAFYLADPRAERPGLRRRLAALAAVSAAVGVLGALSRTRAVAAALWPLPESRLPLDFPQTILLLAIGIPALACLVVYWRRLAWPHRLNTLFFGVLAPWDGRFAALFGMVAAVLLAATVFRQSIDSSRLRPAFKHAEWYFFWLVLAVAVWAIAS